ncbi:MAG: SH3-like domain-containing protein [Myxococcota bacterium]|jgi:SH3-like domain-containing protein
MLAGLLLSLCAMQSSTDFAYATISADSAKIHAFYDSKSAVVFTAAKDTPLKVVAEMYPWSKVQIPGGYDLWVYKSLTELDAEQGIYHVTGSRIRARPLPSTATASHPLGLFPWDCDLVPLVIEEEWIKVRAPESMAAWVLSASIIRSKDNLDAAWQEHLAQRLAISVVEVEVPAEEVVEEMIEEAIVTDNDKVTAATASATVVLAPPTLSSFDEGAIAVNPEAFFKFAIPALEQLGRKVVKDYHTYDFDFISTLEAQLAYVLWHASNPGHVKTARAAFAKIDGMRSYYLSRIDNEIIDTPLARKGNLNPALRKLRDRASFSRDTTLGTNDIVVGWIEFRPRGQSNYPFEIVRGKSNYLLESPDSHYKLRDFANRQVIVRGSWQVTPGNDSRPVFEISELRLMPKAASL